MPSFPTTPKPDYPIQETAANPDVLVSKHRDGSEQRRLKGAGEGPVYDLKYAMITAAQRGDFLAHWVDRNGTLSSWTWTHPERTSETHTVRYLEAPVFTLTGFGVYEGSIKLKVVPA